MELDAGEVAAGHRGDQRAAIVDQRQPVGGVDRPEMIAVDEIGVARSFQPICGIFRPGAGAIGTTSPAIQSSPWWSPCSRPTLAISCMPTQMPRKGRPASRTTRVSASTMPGTSYRPRRQSAKAPTPGRTMRSARATSAGSAETRTAVPGAASPAARSSALAAERRLPEP
jgi:hypothetical protein